MMNRKMVHRVLLLAMASCGFAQQVGIVFQTWNREWRWGANGSNSITEPVFGYYDSQDVEIIKKQGMMLRDANVDFVVTDWTNNIDYHPSLGHVNPDIGHIEESTVLVAETWAKIPGAPKITIVLGSAYGITMSGWHVPDGDWNTDGTPGPRLRMKFDQIHRTFIENPALKEQFYHVDGKPFIILWGNPMDRDIRDPNNIPFDFEWRDDRFTMRHMIGLASSKPWIINDHQGEFVTVHKGVWTWSEQSGRRGLAYLDGKLDCMAVNPTAADTVDGLRYLQTEDDFIVWNIWIRPQPAEVPGWTRTGPNGFTYSGPDFRLDNIQVHHSGVYTGIYRDPTGKTAKTLYRITVQDAPTALLQDKPSISKTRPQMPVYNLLGRRLQGVR